MICMATESGGDDSARGGKGAGARRGSADRSPGGGTGTLYLCATPIGNLEDVTLRVLSTLKSVSLVAAEDTRRTRRLFARYDIHTRLASYREENRERAGRLLVERLERGDDVALVSDAGTPGISDPGSHLVTLCLERDIPVVALPGPNAALSALVVSGLPTRRFAFEGFLPRKRGPRRRALEELASDGRTLIFYESPGRIEETLEDVAELFGDRRVVLARELTKRFEQVLRGTASEVLGTVRSMEVRGEIVLVIEGCRAAGPAVSMDEAVALVEELRESGKPLKEAVTEVASRGSGLSRGELYNETVRRRE